MRLSLSQATALRLPGRSAETRTTEPARDAAGRPPEVGGPVWPALVACLALAGLTMLLPATPTYDPWAWILWGREITQLDLVTTGGPSWKPLPILFTTVFSLFGEEAAPLLWVWIARAGGMLSLVMAYRLGRRLTGPGLGGVVAGVAGAAALATTYNYARDAALGNSEPLLAALALWAFERHLDGRRDHALYLGFAVALLRPEAWPFLGLYGLWLFFAEPRLRLRLVAFALAIPLLWFGPELWGSGDALRASSRANDPNPESAAFAAHPGLEVAYRFHERTIRPIEALGGLAVVIAIVTLVRQRLGRPTVALAAIGLAWLGLVAVMTEAGYAGNQRYLVVTTAAICVLAGVGAGRLIQGVQLLARRVTPRPAVQLGAGLAALVAGLAFLTPAIADKVDNTQRVGEKLGYEASLWGNLPEAIEKAGGREALLRCGSLYSGPFQTQMVAWAMGVHGIDVAGIGPTPAPGVSFRTHTTQTGKLVPLVDDGRFRPVASNRRWRIGTAPRADARGERCPAASPDAPRVAPGPQTPPSLPSPR